MTHIYRFIFLLSVGILFSPPVLAIQFVFDYTYDTNNFFGSVGSVQRSALEEAASFFETHIVDSLDAITPGGGNSWLATFYDPTNTAAVISVNNLSIAADTLYVFVGSEDRGAGNLALAAPGGLGGGSGTAAFVNSVQFRGQAGASAPTPTDFGPWGGSMSFNDNASIDWAFDTGADPGPSQFDFYSTALHEIAHVLGLATAPSFMNQVNGSDEFTGSYSVAENGGNVVLTSDGHVDGSVMSTVFGTATVQQTLMADASAAGTRNFATDLDMAMLQDTGWQVVPEPGSALLLFSGCGYLLLRRRRRSCETALVQ